MFLLFLDPFCNSFYENEEKDEEKEPRKSDRKDHTQKRKPVFLKDVKAMHLLSEDTNKYEEDIPIKPGGEKSYIQEQEMLKRALIEAADQVSFYSPLPIF